MVSVEDYSITGIGETTAEAMRAYKQGLKSKRNLRDIAEGIEAKSIKDKITRINNDVKQGNTFYYLTIDSSEGIFIGTFKSSDEIVLSRVGDDVTLEYDDSYSGLMDITAFNNHNIGSN